MRNHVSLSNTPDIVEILRADPQDLTFDQAESALAILSLKCKCLQGRLYTESGLSKYGRSLAA